jgi:hypothetical protein
VISVVKSAGLFGLATQMISANAVSYFDEEEFLERRRKARHTGPRDQEYMEAEKEILPSEEDPLMDTTMAKKVNPQCPEDPLMDTTMREGNPKAEKEIPFVRRTPKLKITYGDIRRHVEKETTNSTDAVNYESSGSKILSNDMLQEIEKVMYARRIDLSDAEMHVEIVYGENLPMISIMHANSEMEVPSENMILSYAMSAVESINPSEPDPKNYREAMTSDNAILWKKALQEEYTSLIENGTWSELKDLPKGRKALGSKWVFSTKRSGLNVIERYKARNVVQGFRQKEGFDYEETFAPVANQASVKILLTIAATLDLELIQYDIKTAFLHGDIDIPEIYIKQPEGFIKPGMENKVFELLKSQYGIKQASRIWNIMLHKSLVKAGLKQSRRDPCLYYKFTKEETTIASIYVDDLKFATNVGHKYFDLIKEDGINIQKVSGDQYLGIRIERDRESKTIMMSQQAYVERALEKFGMNDCSTVSTPIANDMKLTEKMCPTTKEDRHKMADKPYRELIGTLMYLSTSTRPDIAKAVSNVSRYLINPGILHWVAAQRILRYLKRTKDFKLHLGGNHPLKLRAFSDADWAGDLDQRRSTTGYVIKLGNSLISWKSRFQTTTATSTTEAEYYAIGDTLKEILYLLPIMDDLNMPQSFPIIIDEDNQGCIAVSKNMINTSRSKHVDIKYHFIREHVENGITSLEYCPTGEMQADILTKGLAEPQHAKLTKLLGLKRIDKM